MLEHAAGYPMARARVRLDRIDASGRVQSATVLAVIVIRTSPASVSLRGRIVESGQPVAVLWPADVATRRLSQGRRALTTNGRGEFRWDSPPDEYRLAASFDLDPGADGPVEGSLTVSLRDGTESTQEAAPVVLP